MKDHEIPHLSDLDRLTETLIGPETAMPHDASSVPIFQTSSFLFDRYEDMAAVFAGQSDRYIYTRGNNPTVAELEALIARMEGVEAARGFASGMAAIASAVLPFVEAGSRVVAVNNLYSDAFRLFECVLKKFGVTTDYVDGTDTEAVLAALPGASLIYLESPTSWSFTTQDLSAIGAEARRLGVVSVIDNSWATPLFQRPAEFGIDLIVHAASKYLAGHSDTIAGLVAGPKALMDRINHEAYHYLGGKMSPFDAWLVLRGMRSLHLRMARHCANGLALGRALSAHPAVTHVRHPAFEANPGNACLSGYGGLFAFDLDDSIDIARFTNALRVVKIGVSWGGPESLVIPAQAALGLSGAANVFQRFGTPAGSVRIAAGLEQTETLVEDVLNAIEEGRRVTEIKPLAEGDAWAGAKWYDLADRESGAVRRVFLWVPPEAAGQAPTEGWPVLYMTDGNAVIATAIDAMRAQACYPSGTNTGWGVLVAIGYPTEDAYDPFRRSWDLGPPPGQNYPPFWEDGEEVRTGGGGEMARFLLEDVRSFVAAKVRVNPEHQGLFGHSFGGLFALWLLFQNPKAFSHWIAASPATTWEESFLLDHLSRFDAGAAQAYVHLSAGEWEGDHLAPFQTQAPDAAERLKEKAKTRTIAAAQEMAAALSKHPGLTADYETYGGENHMSVLPVAVNRAIQRVFALS